MTWNQSETWERTYGRSFRVEVKHWSAYGKNKWNVYVYLYSDNPLFNKLKRVSDRHVWDTRFHGPLHGGITYFKRHRSNDGKICSIQIGCDYQHYMDDRFEDYETKEDAYEVFADAEELYTWMLGLEPVK